MWPIAILGWWLLLVSWVFLPGVAEPFLLPRQALFEVGALAIILHTLGTRSARRRWRNPPALLFMGWVLTHFVVGFWWPVVTTPAMVSNILFNWYTLVPFLNLLIGFLLAYCLVTHLFPFEPYAHDVTKWVCWVSVSVAGYSLLQYLGADQFFSDPKLTWFSMDRPNHMIATMGNVSYVSMFLGLTAPLFLLFRQRRYLVFLVVVLLALLVMGKTYGILGAGIGLLTYAWIRGYYRYPQIRSWFWGVVVGLGVIGIVVGVWGRHLLLTNPRWMMWTLMWGFIQHRPLMGFGLGSYAVQFFLNWESIGRTLPIPNQGSRWMWAHNDLWQAVFEFGMVGAGLILMAVWSVLQRAWRKTFTAFGAGYFACGISLGVVSLMNFPWHFAPTLIVALIVWSMLETEGEEPVAWPEQTPRLQEVLSQYPS